MWERDGYWFFRDVLDPRAIGGLRATYLRVLKDVGAIDEVAGTVAIHNGSNLADFPVGRLDRLHEDPLSKVDPMKEFIADPKIHDLFKNLIGDEPVWLPVTEYHAVPHRPRTTDLPPSSIPDSMPIPQVSIPPDAWRRSDYQPGDLLVFDKDAPHSGLANYSQDRFRLSMDIRLMAASDRLPDVGVVTQIDARLITVLNDSGLSRCFDFDDSTYCRTMVGRVAVGANDEIARYFPVGSKVIVSSENGMARLIRPRR